MTLFAFDLDGTVTRCELLPRIAAAISREREMADLTRLTLSGALPFEESFLRRFAMLRGIPLERIWEMVGCAPLDADILQFIKAHREQCVIVTGNLDLWVAPLLERIGCRYFASEGEENADGLRLKAILDKGEVLRRLRVEDASRRTQAGKAAPPVRIVATGEGINDIPMLREAEVPIAFAGVHTPAPEVLRHALHVVGSGAALCALLEREARAFMPEP